MNKTLEANWVKAASLSTLRDRGRLLVRLGSRQLALFDTKAGVFACSNRCPHEGYPLVDRSMMKTSPTYPTLMAARA